MRRECAEPKPAAPPAMHTTVELVGPEIAAHYLRRVHENQRVIRKSKVDEYANAMKRGDWVLTPEGLAFDTDGVLIQGCHRLHAIIASGETLPFNVTRNASKKAFSVLDQGLKRAASDALGIPKKYLEIASVFMRALWIKSPSVQQTERVYRRIEPAVLDLLPLMTSTTARGFTAAIRAGVVLQRLNGAESEWLADQYNKMIGARFGDFTPMQISLYKRLSGSTSHFKGGTHRQLLELTLAFKAFDESRQNISKLYATEQDHDNVVELIKRHANIERA